MFHIETHPFNLDDIRKSKNDTFVREYPVDYIIYNDDYSEAYVGETAHFITRMKNHYNNPDRKKLNMVRVYGHERFNKSATYEIETRLIEHMEFDSRFKRIQNSSQTNMSTAGDFYQKGYYADKVFNELWDDMVQYGLAEKSTYEIEQSAIFAMSPFKSLTAEQFDLKQQVIDLTKHALEKDEQTLIFIRGDAGTGKTVVMSSIFYEMQKRAKQNYKQWDAEDENTEPKDQFAGTRNYLLNNHADQINVYKDLARRLNNVLRVGDFKKPTSFINEMLGVVNKNTGERATPKGSGKADVVFVDEAHLLLSEEDHFNSFYGESHISELLKIAKVLVLVFDPNQVVMGKSLWNDDMLDKIKARLPKQNVLELRLEKQMRMQASPNQIAWIEDIVQGRHLRKFPIPDKKGYEIKVFDNPTRMYDAIKSRNDEDIAKTGDKSTHGLSRMLATFDFEWHTIENENSTDGRWHVAVENTTFSLPWNYSGIPDGVWSQEDSIGEVGSTYTIQGFDLNYVGVILGSSIRYDSTRGIYIDPSLSKDSNAKKISKNSTDAEAEVLLTLRNSLNVLLTRGVSGLYLYAVDPALREYLLDNQEGKRQVKNYSELSQIDLLGQYGNNVAEDTTDYEY